MRHTTKNPLYDDLFDTSAHYRAPSETQSSPLTKCFCVVVKTHKRRSNKIYKFELTKIKIENQVKCNYRVDPQRTRLTLIAELTWSNLGIKKVLKK